MHRDTPASVSPSGGLKACGTMPTLSQYFIFGLRITLLLVFVSALLFLSTSSFPLLLFTCIRRTFIQFLPVPLGCLPSSDRWAFPEANVHTLLLFWVLCSVPRERPGCAVRGWRQETDRCTDTHNAEVWWTEVSAGETTRCYKLSNIIVYSWTWWGRVLQTNRV